MRHFKYQKQLINELKLQFEVGKIISGRTYLVEFFIFFMLRTSQNTKGRKTVCIKINYELFKKFSLIRPPECHHHFSVATLVGVLKRATQKRKFIRDEKTVDRLDAKDRETSRSDSQASEAPSKIANPQQSVTGELKMGYL